jgi:hypothetical protein
LAWVRDAADSLNDSVITGKHRQIDVSLQHRVARKIVSDSDGSDVENASNASTPSLKATSDTGTDKTTDADGTNTNKAQAAYQQTKEMGDEDCKVSLKF